MDNILRELNEKLQEICNHLDIDSDNYIVIEKMTLNKLIRESDELKTITLKLSVEELNKILTGDENNDR